MTADAAERAGVEHAWAHVRIEDSKVNNLPPVAARWIKLRTVKLAHGDTIGVATPWQWPDPFAGVKASDLLAVQMRIAKRRYRENFQAADWVGKPIADALGLSVKNKGDRRRITALIQKWVENGALVVVEGEDGKRMKRTYIEVGEWATDAS